MKETGYLLDTNVISELMKAGKASPAVMAWHNHHRDCRLYLSVISLGEIRRGVEAKRLVDPGRANRLEFWLQQITVQFATRILDFGAQEADIWGRIAPTERLPEADTMLAATAIEHQLTMVTRNFKDFAMSGALLVNPWEFQP